jgi:hypothetical protein
MKLTQRRLKEVVNRDILRATEEALTCMHGRLRYRRYATPDRARSIRRLGRKWSGVTAAENLEIGVLFSA